MSFDLERAPTSEHCYIFYTQSFGIQQRRYGTCLVLALLAPQERGVMQWAGGLAEMRVVAPPR